MNATERDINEQASGYSKLGWLVYWELLDLLPGHKPVNGQQAKTDWDNGGMCEEFTPTPKDADAAYSHAVRRGAVGIRDHGVRAKLLECPQAPEYKGARRIHAVVDLDAQHDATGKGYDIEANARALIGYLMGDTDGNGDPMDDGSRIRTNDPLDEFGVPTDPIVCQVFSEYRDALKYVAPDAITRAIQQELNLLSHVPMRTHGGIYFVPEQDGALARLRELQQVVEGWGSSRLHLLGVPDTVDERRAVQGAVGDSFHQELTQTLAQVEQYQAKLAEWSGGDVEGDQAPVRQATLERRLTELQELHQRAQLYAEVLEIKADDLTTGIGDLETMITTTLKDVFGVAA